MIPKNICILIIFNFKENKNKTIFMFLKKKFKCVKKQRRKYIHKLLNQMKKLIKIYKTKIHWIYRFKNIIKIALNYLMKLLWN